MIRTPPMTDHELTKLVTDGAVLHENPKKALAFVWEGIERHHGSLSEATKEAYIERLPRILRGVQALFMKKVALN